MEECDPNTAEGDKSDSQNRKNDNDDCHCADEIPTQSMEDTVAASKSTDNDKTENQQVELQYDETFLKEKTKQSVSSERETRDITNLVVSSPPDAKHTPGLMRSDPVISSSSNTRSRQDGHEQLCNERPGAYSVQRRAPGTVPSRSRGVLADDNQVDTDIVATVVVDEESLPIVYPSDVKYGESIRRNRRRLFILICVLVCSLIGMVVALAITKAGKESEANDIEGIRDERNISWAERYSITCGIPYTVKGFGVRNEDGNYDGFSIDLCYAVAAALFGEDYRDRIILYGEELIEPFSSLANKDIDLLAEDKTHTMERHVYKADENTGFTFTAPYFHTGLAFGGNPSFVVCAENKNTTGDCADLRVCVLAGTTHVDVVRDLIPEENIVQVSVKAMDEFYAYLNTSTCNVIAGEQQHLSKTILDTKRLQGPYEVGRKIFSKEPLAMMTHNDDTQWSDFVNWVLQALMAAEKHNITQNNAHEMPTTDVFGEKYKNMFIHAVGAVGNYGEIYSRHMEEVIPRQGMNLINDGTSGLIYSHPFGNLLDDASSGHIEDGILEDIFQRGYLKCGVIEYSKLDDKNLTSTGIVTDYCYALSAGIFQDYSEETKHNRTRMVSVSSTEAFTSLNGKEVDVIVAVAVNITNDVLGNMSFSQPIYYDNNGDPVALATWQYDVQWSSFVYWTVASTFYAEENNITQGSSDKMPLLNLFGPHHKMMMRQIAKAVGNYGDIYERNVGSLGPRSGLNMLNLESGPQMYPLPGIFD